MPVDPVLRVPDLAIDSKYLVERAISRFQSYETDRAEWIRRREDYYLGWDDFTTSTRKGLFEGSSNFHLPLTEIQSQAMHAKILQAIFFTYPWFYVDPQEDADVQRVQKIERFMRYVLERYSNYNRGIYSACDDWAWDLTTDGIGILSRGWVTNQRRAIVVDENPEFLKNRVDLRKMLEDTEEADFDKLAKKFLKFPYVENSIIRTVFNGPVLVAEDPSYVLFKGMVVDATDLDEHETVIKVCYFTRDQLLAWKDSEYFDEEVTMNILSQPADKRGVQDARINRVRIAQDYQTGVNSTNPQTQDDVYEFLVVYDRVNLQGRENDNTHYRDEIVHVVHPKSMQLCRWTFLDRISPSGKRPLHMAHLYRRPRRSTGRGMVQTMYALNECQDILINQSLDAGILANNPMFGYRGDSPFDPQEIRVEPGLGIKCGDPNQDIRFFQWPVNPNWSLPIQNMISSMASQMTSIGPTQLGQVGANVGPLRSTSGVNALNSMSDVQLDVVIRRVKECMSGVFEGLYMDCQQWMDDKMKVSVLGADGEPLTDDEGNFVREEISKEDLRTRVHFGLYANSQNLNRMAQKQAAMEMAQMLLQRVGLETGVVRPENIYEVYMNVLRASGVMRPERFISKPTGGLSVPIQIELQMIMQGIVPTIVMADQEREKKIEAYQKILDSDEAALELKYGHVHKDAMVILKKVLQQHERMLETVKKPSNMQNPTGNNQSPTLGVQGGNNGAGAVEAPQEGEAPTNE